MAQKYIFVTLEEARRLFSAMGTFGLEAQLQHGECLCRSAGPHEPGCKGRDPRNVVAEEVRRLVRILDEDRGMGFRRLGVDRYRPYAPRDPEEGPTEDRGALSGFPDTEPEQYKTPKRKAKASNHKPTIPLDPCLSRSTKMEVEGITIEGLGTLRGTVDFWTGLPATRWEPEEPPEIQGMELRNVSGTAIPPEAIFDDEYWYDSLLEQVIERLSEKSQDS